MDTINHEIEHQIFNYSCKGVCYNSHTISANVVIVVFLSVVF